MVGIIYWLAFFMLGYWKQKGTDPRTIKKGLIFVVATIVVHTVFNILKMPENVRELYSEQPVFSLIVMIGGVFLSGLFLYGLYRLGAYCAKKKKKGQEKWNINPDYDSWPSVEREIDKGDVEAAKNIFGKDMLLTYEALEAREWNKKYKVQYSLIKKAARPFFQCFSDHTPIMDLQEDGSIILLYSDMEASYVYKSWPIKKSPTGNLHRKGVINFTMGNNVSTILRYELCTGDDEQWWLLESPDGNFILTTSRGLISSQ